MQGAGEAAGESLLYHWQAQAAVGFGFSAACRSGRWRHTHAEKQSQRWQEPATPLAGSQVPCFPCRLMPNVAPTRLAARGVAGFPRRGRRAYAVDLQLATT